MIWRLVGVAWRWWALSWFDPHCSVSFRTWLPLKCYWLPIEQLSALYVFDVDEIAASIISLDEAKPLLRHEAAHEA
ncbi:hypothetical protein D3C79_849750 [compost metagenome]